MSCPYYWWNNHYACRKSGKDVNEEVYYKYCRTYSYDDCPIYKGESVSGCFLTSACVEYKGLTDDCYELATLRYFRDDYLRHTEYGDNEICEYYHIAPSIVEKIKQDSNHMAVFQRIYDELVLPCVRLIERGLKHEAHIKYREYVKMLAAEYLQEK